MTAEIVRSRETGRDLEAIWDWITESDSNAADRVLRAIDAAILRLGTTPRMGRERSDLAPGVRSILSGQHVVLYRYSDTAMRIEIIRILHQRRDIAALFDRG